MSKKNPLAFSTLGCPAWDLDRILQAAVEYGYDSLELRGYLTEMDLPKADPFTPTNRAATRQRLEDAGLTVSCVSASARTTGADPDQVKAYAELGRDLGAPFVRVFGGNLPADLPRDEGIARAADTLRLYGDLAQAAGVTIALETHDAFSTGAQVAELLAATAHPAVVALWDLHHPFRQGESPEETNRYIGSSTGHTHVKDGLDGTYTLLGEGDIPIFPMLDLLLDGGYTGPISLEWEKRWKPDIADPEIAFPQYAQALRAYLQGRNA